MPVTKEDSSEARNDAPALFLPPRRTGRWDMVNPSLSLLLGVKKLHEWLGSQRPQTERIYQDDLPRMNHRQFASQGQNCPVTAVFAT